MAGQPRYCRRTTSIAAEITVSGTLSKLNVFGPPGYGEYPKTDSRGKVMLLKLDDPLRVTRANDDMPKGPIVVNEVEIIPFIYRQKKFIYLWRMVGQHVVLSGKVYSTDRPPVIKPIMMIPVSAKAGDRVAC